MVVAEIFSAIRTELSGWLAAASLVSLKLFCASEAPNVANFNFLTCPHDNTLCQVRGRGSVETHSG